MDEGTEEKERIYFDAGVGLLSWSSAILECASLAAACVAAWDAAFVSSSTEGQAA